MGIDQNGSVLRPYQGDDLLDVVELLNLAERQVTGQNFTSPDDFTADMKSNGFHPETDTAVILSDSGKPVGYAEVIANRVPMVRLRSYGRVHPAFRGRGYGTRLVQWTEERGRQLINKAPAGARVVLHHFVYADQTDAIALLIENGYQHVRSNYRMLIDLNENRQPSQIPDGIILRPIENTEEDLRAAAWVDHQSFLGHWGMVEEPFEDFFRQFKQRFENRPKYDLSACLVAAAGKTPVGLAICSIWTEEDPDKGWVNVLGVLNSWRKRGIGLALLLEVFDEFRKRRKNKAGLFVDADNLSGALGLYLEAGMHVELESQFFEKELRPGVDLMVRGEISST